MTSYRRNLVPGGSYFFTVNLADRRLSLLTDHVGLLRAAFRHVRTRHPFTIEAAVILPDHLHAMDFTGRGFLLRHALAPHKGNVFSRIAGWRGHINKPSREGRARNLAAALLGTYPAGRRRLRAARQLHSFQSGEARVCELRWRLAAFVVS
jgi:hypothetical protein